jgi:hypothetical protein
MKQSIILLSIIALAVWYFFFKKKDEKPVESVFDSPLVSGVFTSPVSPKTTVPGTMGTPSTPSTPSGSDSSGGNTPEATYSDANGYINQNDQYILYNPTPFSSSQKTKSAFR